MLWNDIRQSENLEDFVREIWQKEQTLPEIFKNASKAWTKDLPDFLAFAKTCQEIFALFDERDKLYFCVFIEQQTNPAVMNIHLSVLNKLKPSVFIAESQKLRNLLLRRGVRIIRGWILQKNFALCRLLLEIGFQQSSLVMRFGESHGQVLKWKMVQIIRG